MSPIDKIVDFLGKYSEIGSASMAQADWLADALERLCADALAEHKTVPNQDAMAKAVLRWALTIGIGVIPPHTLAFIDTSLGKKGVLRVLDKYPEWTAIPNEFPKNRRSGYFVISRTLLAEDKLFTTLFQTRERVV